MVVSPDECPRTLDCGSDTSTVVDREWHMNVVEELRECDDCGCKFRVTYEPSMVEVV